MAAAAWPVLCALLLAPAAGPAHLPPGDETEMPEPSAEGGFMGRAELPRDEQNHALVPDPSMDLVHYFQDRARDPDLELQLQAQNEGPGEQRYAFIQSLHGVPILGTFALAQLQDGLLHYERHFFVHPPEMDVTAHYSAAQAQVHALDIVRDQERVQDVVLGQGQPALAVYYASSEVAALVWVVAVRTVAPFHSFELFVDANTGALRGRHKTSMEQVQGTVHALVEPCCQGDQLVAVPLPHVEFARGLFTLEDGSFSAPGVVDQAEVQMRGPFFRVESYGDPGWLFQTELRAAPAFNEVALVKVPLSVVDPFYYASQARAWLRRQLAENSNLATSRVESWTRSQFPIRVNLPSGHMGFNCNAFYDGQALNFYVADRKHGCNNSGQAAKIVYHEYGHGVHDHLTWSRATFDAQVSEGAADYIAATMTGDPNITGLLGCKEVLRGRSTRRTCVNHYTYCHGRKCHSFPHDEPHNSAPILCGALWELRQALGPKVTDALFLRFLTLASDMNSVYEAIISADDDEDGDPTNGTDNSCDINRAFLGAEGGLPHFPDAVKRAVPCVPGWLPQPAAP